MQPLETNPSTGASVTNAASGGVRVLEQQRHRTLRRDVTGVFPIYKSLFNFIVCVLVCVVVHFANPALRHARAHVRGSTSREVLPNASNSSAAATTTPKFT